MKKTTTTTAEATKDEDASARREKRLTFVDVGGQAAHEHLAGEALHALPVLVGVTAVGAVDSRDALVAVAVVKEVVVNGEEGGATCKKMVMGSAINTWLSARLPLATIY